MNPRLRKRILADLAQAQKDLNIDLLREQIDEDRDQNDSALNGGLAEGSKATVHYVPPLALPTSDTATEFLQVSRLPSSHR